jgi:hypothetical protein
MTPAAAGMQADDKRCRHTYIKETPGLFFPGQLKGLVTNDRREYGLEGDAPSLALWRHGVGSRMWVARTTVRFFQQRRVLPPLLPDEGVLGFGRTVKDYHHCFVCSLVGARWLVLVAWVWQQRKLIATGARLL